MNLFHEVQYTSNDHEEQPKLSSQKETKDETRSNYIARRYSGKYFIISQRPKFGESLILLVVRTQISVELQSRYLNEASKNL